MPIATLTFKQVVLSSQPSKAYNAFIQELSDNQGPVVVFLEELGEKRTVPYISLRHFPASRNGCQYSLSDGGYIPYIDRKKNKKKSVMLITDSNSQQNNYQNNYHNNRRYSSPRHWIQSGVKTMQLPTHQIDYNTSVNLDVSNTQYCPVTTPPTIMTNTGLPVTNPPAYYMPVLNVPYPPNLGQVNLSQDPYGKDLPQDVNTLRYFYNFGVEASVNNIGVNQGSCRMMSTVMQQPTMAYPPTMMPDGQTHMIMPAPVEHGQFVSSDSKYNTHFPQLNSSNTSVRKSVTINVSSETVSPNGKESNIKTDQTESSETVADTVEDNSRVASPGKLDSPGSDSGLDSTTSSTEDQSTTYTVDTTGHNKVKGKKKYYMYGNLKLVKPIKDIPPRFQMLLAETSAAKARCEGQPIYQQVPENHMMEHDMELNANARCFVPMQSMPIPSCTLASGVGVNTNGSMALPNACYPPPPPNVLGSAPPVISPKSNIQTSNTHVQPNIIPSVQSSGGGTCYYIYSSTGYSSLPPTIPTPTTSTPAGTSPVTTVPPPQPVVYMMNSPYPPNQPCSYPTLQPVHGYGMCSASAQ
ncbi:hypothetical protein LOTGIDRAFT_165607 [Lottia gigantea]|uniref:Uncharacterized protein n=1 Tax=Lottia gigantea TaxID=225164 RepID=V4A0N6_LOTGI|nr:hypothetical protein LOTGIDRAFT_165607 [Lottia gigantea]ESO88480.1 hypothetical protein LOTGIDRAFT_165607 [Lottia gigantea]